MPITSIAKDLEALTLTIIAEFDASVSRVWNAYADPRQIEKFWGPPEWPATFTRHDMHAGGLTNYHMTGPDGEKSAGFWKFTSVDAPHRFEVIDGFALDDGSPNTELPTMRMTFEFAAHDGGTRMTSTTYFDSLEELKQLIEMGMEEGTKAAMGQIDAVVTDLRSFAADLPTAATILSDTQVRISRVIRGKVEDVWRAHHEPDLVTRWMLGPDGWEMPVCEVATKLGQSYRYEWQQTNGSERFGFTGELTEFAPPYRAVTTERMIDTEGPSTVNEMTLTAVDGGTLLTFVITYPDADLRDQILGTGMVDGMEFGYQRLESLV